MADLDGTSLELDAKRRAYYARKRKHIKENIEKTDMGHTPAPQEDEDPELISAFFTTCCFVLSGRSVVSRLAQAYAAHFGRVAPLPHSLSCSTMALVSAMIGA